MDQKKNAAPEPQLMITPEQVKAAADAAREILEGAPPQRILELTDRIVIAKLFLAGVAKGELVVMRPVPPTSAKKSGRVAKK